MGIPAASGRGVCFLGADQNLSAFFCRSSEMLLASLVAITRNGCARSAFQPHLAGVFAFWVRTKTCPLFAQVRHSIGPGSRAHIREICSPALFPPRRWCL